VVWSTGTMRNNPFGGGGVPNGLESMAGPMLCCVLCCMCIFLTIVIACKYIFLLAHVVSCLIRAHFPCRTPWKGLAGR
jgi:hypothetical protein